MQLTLNIGSNAFAAAGDDVTGDTILPALRLWLNAQQPGSDAEKLDALTQQLKRQNDALAAAVQGVPGGTDGA